MIDINGWIQQFEKWLTGPNFTNPYSQVSIRGYCAHARRFLDALDYDGVEDLSEVSIAMVRKYIRTGQHGEKSKRSSQYVKMATLMLFYEFISLNDDSLPNLALSFQEENRAQRARSSGGRGGFKEKRLVPVLTWKEMDQLFSHTDRGTSYAAMRDKSLIRFILDTGLRASEVVAMTVKDAGDYFEGRIRLVGKGNKERLVRFQPEGIEAMRNWLQIRHRSNPETDALFVTDQGKAIPAKALHTMVSRLLIRAGIEKPQCGPHLLRHTAASAWLAKGMDLRQVQENMGHANIATSSRYLHLLE
ncbi:tyrosine-type recombinase/integrase [Acidithiobacillus concretivorus]|uniref:Tyrosine-type recombinase/integrase n=1 Tax=Acidithiobacillus concretivorus TaxID=3063952 RepID=A0ABS5ZU35_9PROT|nr:tyrosine-type recombinase/integrase [Acidithiobacillus concretivorus]MBU2740022.1 tyrosine-type recombinase/integrase [Acidithiobacillus concretivorus]